jgi:hypothetical protein
MAARSPFCRTLLALIQAAACALLLLSGQPGTALAWCQLKAGESVAGSVCSEGGIPLAWEQRCISYAVLPSERPDLPPEDALEAIDASFDSWTRVRCDGVPLDLQVERLKDFSQCSVPQHNPDGPNLNSIAFVTDWLERYNPQEAFALTSVWHDKTTGEILDVDMELNEDPELADLLGEFGICPDESVEAEPGESPRCALPDLVDIQNVVTHEAGHVLGLGHSVDPDSVMRYQAETGDLSKRTLAPDDREAICAVYPPGSLPEECDWTPRGGLTLKCYERKQTVGCGCAIAGRGPGHDRPWALAALLLGSGLLGRQRRRRGAGSGGAATA